MRMAGSHSCHNHSTLLHMWDPDPTLLPSTQMHIIQKSPAALFGDSTTIITARQRSTWFLLAHLGAAP